MERTLTLSIDECDSILLSMILDFKNSCSKIDTLVLDEKSEREEFDLLMELGALIQKIADVRDTLCNCHDCC